MGCSFPASVICAAVALVSVGSVGCTGSIGELDKVSDNNGTPNSNNGGNGPPGTAASCKTTDVGPTPLRRLTRAQYDETVAALLGDTAKPGKSFVPDETLLGFAAGLSVSSLLVDQYMSTAEALAATAVTNLPKLLGCDPKAMGEDACASQFMDKFGKRAWRRPLTSEEKTDLTALYTANKASSGFAKAIEIVVQALLESPDFLYRIELGSPTKLPGIVKLNQWELASRLSYFLWNSMPDDALFDAAGSGKLDTDAGLKAEVERMTKDARMKVAVNDFAAQWLSLDKLATVGKDAKTYPGFDDKLRTAMADETLSFVEEVVLRGDGKFSTLMTAPWSFVNEPLAAVYGMAGVSGTAMVRKDLPAGQRFGLLTHPSVMSVNAKTNQSSPVHRGLFVREHLLCQTPPAPPPGLMVQAPDPAPGLTTRQRFAEHSTNNSCSGCHRLLDPLGFGFEHYDGMGRFREKDGNDLVDARGEVHETSDIDGTFNGAGQLAMKLASSKDAAECVVSNWFVYALGRSAANDRDTCSVSRLNAAFKASSGNLRTLVADITATDAFRFSRIDSGSQGGM